MEMTKKMKKSCPKAGVQKCRSRQPIATAVAFAASFYRKEAQAVEAHLIPLWERRVALTDLDTHVLWRRHVFNTSPFVFLLLD